MYRFQFYLLLFFRRLLLLLPEQSRFRLGDALGKLSYRLVKSRRQTALWNLQLAFPEKSEEEREALALESFQIMTKYFLSTLWYHRYLKEHISVLHSERIENAYHKNKGVMAAVIHMGNMESAVKAKGDFPTVTVAKDQRNPYIDKFIVKNREETLGIEVLEKGKQTVRQLQNYMKQDKKYIYALFSDHRDKGAKVTFFGLETVAPTGAVSFAYKYDMPLIIVYSCMQKDNSSVIHISEEIPLLRTDNAKQDILDNTQRLIHEIEAIIRKHPEQWMWFHDRWNMHRNYKKEGILPPFLTQK